MTWTLEHMLDHAFRTGQPVWWPWVVGPFHGISRTWSLENCESGEADNAIQAPTWEMAVAERDRRNAEYWANKQQEAT